MFRNNENINLIFIILNAWFYIINVKTFINKYLNE